MTMVFRLSQELIMSQASFWLVLFQERPSPSLALLHPWFDPYSGLCADCFIDQD
jgi:hypothetical protein